MATIDITAENFEETITDNDIVLVDFWADWCGPCKRFGPVYEKASEEYDGIVFAKLDTDANYELTGQLGIEGIPTLMAFREGVLVFNQAGALPGSALKHGRSSRSGRQAQGRARAQSRLTKPVSCQPDEGLQGIRVG
jgi:thioredoxin 1